MAALKKIKIQPQDAAVEPAGTGAIRAISEGQVIEPVSSPAHDLQKALHRAGYRPEIFGHRPQSNTMLVLTLVCVYALSMLMFFGSLTA